MNRLGASIKKLAAGLVILTGACVAQAIEVGDVILNEVVYAPKHGNSQHVKGVELLVVADKVNLNGLQISDRDVADSATEDQCTLQDMGLGFLSSVRAGTLIVVTRGSGADDLDASDFVIRLFAKSSVYCNTSPTTNAFELTDQGDNIHLLYFGKQLDFVKYAGSDWTSSPPGFAGKLAWDNGEDGFVHVGARGENNGLRFLGNKPDLNNYPSAWQVYSETLKDTVTLGRPNGGPNTVWINQLREQDTKRNALVRSTGE